ncbi:MAG: hypothetical protein QOF01_1631 [Thermomicrobiales bacterium]|nr:hypothetical protein [Thermomicrobiales bacterium]
MTRLPSIPLGFQAFRSGDARKLIPWAIAAGFLSLSLADLSIALLFAVVACVSLFVLALHDLSFGVLAIAASVPVQSFASIDLSFVDLTWTKLAVLATLAAWTVRVAAGYSRPIFDGLAAALGCYVLVLAISVIEARSVSAWAEEIYRWAVALAVYLIAIESMRSNRTVKRVVLVVAGAVLALSTLAAWQVITGAGPATFSVGGITRAYGTFGEPNPFAGYLEMTVLLLVAVALGAMARGSRWAIQTRLGKATIVAAVVASVVGTVTLLATQSRGGYLGFAVGVGIAVWLTGGRVRWLGTVGGGICLVAVLVSPFGEDISARFRGEALTTSETQVTTENFAAQERSAHWRAAVSMAESSPIFGVGAGNFDQRYREYTNVWRFRIPRGHAHSAYLQALAQAGGVGLLSYLTLFAVVTRKIGAALRRANDPVSRSVVIGVAAVSAAVAVHNTVEYLHVLSLGLQLSLIWALLSIDGHNWTGTTPDHHGPLVTAS